MGLTGFYLAVAVVVGSLPSYLAGPAQVSRLYAQYWNNNYNQELFGFAEDPEDNLALDDWLDEGPTAPPGPPPPPSQSPSSPPNTQTNQISGRGMPMFYEGADGTSEPVATRPAPYALQNYGTFYSGGVSGTEGGDYYNVNYNINKNREYNPYYTGYYETLAWPTAGEGMDGPYEGEEEDGEEVVIDPYTAYINWYTSKVGGVDFTAHIPAPARGENGTVTEAGGVRYVPLTAAIPNKEPAVGIPNKAPKEEIVYPEIPLLVDPPPVPLPKEECITADEEVGECRSAFDCGFTNGVVNGLCHQGHDASAHARVCCIYPSYCGYETNKEVTYFKSPDYPELTNNTEECHFRVNLLPGVCQLRLDFVEFSLKPLQDGQCDPDNRLKVSSVLQRAHIPVNEFCGKLHEDNQSPTSTDLTHMYIHLDEIPPDSAYTEPPNSPSPGVDLRVRVKNYPSRWNIRISQIQCDGAPLQAPSGCSQYYNEVNGTVRSLNLADSRYPANLNMAACIRTHPAACAIKYLIKEMEFGDVKNRKPGVNRLGYGLTCQDYIAFNGLKSGLCGSTTNKEIILPLNVPQGLNIVTDGLYSPSTDQGFRIQYSFLDNCDTDTNFFAFPTAK